MADKKTTSSIDKENYVKKLKRSFDSWREVVLHINSVLLWKKQAYPWILILAPSVLFMKLLYYDPSFLTALSLLCILITVLDYIGPMISTAIWRQENWTAIKERELEDICTGLAGAIVSVQYYLGCVRDLRATRPSLFYPAAIACLTIMAWIGNSVHNLLIMYLAAVMLLLLPGLIHYGLIQKCYYSVTQSSYNMLETFTSSQKKFH